MAKEKTSLTVVSQEELSLLDGFFVQEGYKKTSFPRISFTSQDKTEGKGKTLHVVTEAGTFFTVRPTDELNEDGKSVWEKKDLGKQIELHIIFERRQLRMYDSATEKFTSSPIYDNATDIVPLFCDKQQVDKGTPAELQAKYMTKTTAKGKPKSALEEERVLYVILDGVTYSMNIRGTSMYQFLSYKKSINPAKVITVITSEEKSSGQVSWNQMNFTALRPINKEEYDMVISTVRDLANGIVEEKAYFNKEEPAQTERAEAKTQSDNEFKNW